MKEKLSALVSIWFPGGLPEKSVPAESLGLFRIIFGVLMIWEMLYFIRLDFVELFLDLPMMRLSYTWTEWIPMLPIPVLEGLVWVLLGAAILITLGVGYRIAMPVFALGFTYIFVLDQAYYNNHLYLLCLLSWWMVFLPLDASLSLRKGPRKTVPSGVYAILRLHIVIVYFFGGIAKINPDWLFRYEPVREILSQAPVIPGILGESLSLHLLVFGGLLFDLLAGPLLLIKKTRPFGLIASITFNVMNAIIFNDINIFPFFMLGSLLLFLEPETTQAWVSQAPKKTKKKSSKKAVSIPESPYYFLPQPVLRNILVGYLIFQCIWPFRHLIIPGAVDWTGQGQLFSWRMKIQNRSIETLSFQVLDYRTKTIIPTDLKAYNVTKDQETALAMYPAQLHRAAKFLGDRAKDKLGHEEVGVRATVKVRFNGRQSRDLVHPETDLYQEEYHPWGQNDWILPLED